MEDRNMKRPIVLSEMMVAGIDFLNIEISKNEVMSGNFSAPIEILNQLLSDQNVAKHFMERVDIFFSGYDGHRNELWEIQEVRTYIQNLDNLFPFWFFFLSKKGGGLYVIVKCHLLPFLKPEAENQYNVPKLQDYMQKRGFPAMNKVCGFVGMNELEIDKLTDRTLDYFIK